MKKFFSLAAKKFFLTTTGLILVSSSSLNATEFISGAQLHEQLTSYLSAQGLKGKPAIAKSRQFRACNSDLRLSPLFGSFQTIEIRCPDEDGWKIAVRSKLLVTQMQNNDVTTSPLISKPTLSKEAVVLKKRVTKNSIIRPSDLSLEHISVTSSADYFTRIDDVAGRRVKRSLRPRQIVEPRHLEEDWMVEKGQPVILQSGFGAVQVFSEGIALQNANLGELARFLNTTSDKEVFGTVVSEQKVVIRAKTSNK